ncbi:MAG: hypothetical protein A3E40_03980 [Candidatus Levybacteria bacterium RIFCSPHIGHO2_12_FULL_37_9]|nr:MAG: hypothetical protein A3E40_03980 [Candidatus Levybacteria bacterium RIFCSPHIGHO2_12_FULL_37_9]
MEIVVDNTIWMTLNTALAIFAVACGWMVIKAKSKIAKLICGILWILFLPNTIYILSDIIHFIMQLNSAGNMTIIALSLQYLLLIAIGILTFVYGTYPLEVLLRLKRFKTTEIQLFIIMFNFVIIFGAFLGRIHRLNSWDVFTDTTKVIGSIKYTIFSVEAMLSIFALGLAVSLLYFLVRNITIKLATGFSGIFR